VTDTNVIKLAQPGTFTDSLNGKYDDQIDGCSGAFNRLAGSVLSSLSICSPPTTAPQSPVTVFSRCSAEIAQG
jgi:hypothetical protein